MKPIALSRFPILRALLLLTLFVVGAARAADGVDAGVLLMVSGEVSLTRAGQAAAAAEGGKLRVGDILAAGSAGRAYLRFTDAGFVILRPGSTLEIQDYHYDAANPGEARVRFNLRQGVVRTITGAGLDKYKERFRLNTPLAAIGVRGTDFTTYADNDVVRVSVHQGGIVMAPYGAQCVLSALGACAGSGAAELFASAAQMLELRKGELRPKLLPAAPNAPDAVSPPGEGEPQPGKTGSRSRPSVHEALAVERIDAVNAQAHQAGLSAPPAPAIPRIRLDWGRWAAIAGLPAEGFNHENLPADKQLVAINAAYALVRDKGFQLPRQGSHSFALQQGEAWLQGNGGTQRLAVDAGSLDIDFAKRSFNTRLDLSREQKTWEIRGAGDITRDGQLVSSYIAGSNAAIRGALGGQGANEAAYIFQRSLDDKQKILGATHWARP